MMATTAKVRERRRANRTGRVFGDASGRVTDGETELHIRDDSDDDETDVCAARTDDFHVWKYRPMHRPPLGPNPKAQRWEVLKLTIFPLQDDLLSD